MRQMTQNAPAPPTVVVVGNAGVDTNVYLDRDDLDPAVEAHFTRNVQYGVPIACDVQDVTRANDPYRHDFVAGADYLFFSAANLPDPEAVMHTWWQWRPELVMVAGLGAKGCALGTAGEVHRIPSPPLDLPVVDTNGAGDALAVGFLASHVLEGRSLAESVLRGQLAARHCCAQPAPKADLVTSAELERYALLASER